MSAIPSALQRLWDEFEPHEPDAILSGIYAAKRGYHNTRANHLGGRNGGSPNDYSIQAPADKRGPALKAAAIDITFDTARRSDFAIIDKYTSRVIDAMKRRDPRLFYNGEAVWREVLGNADSDREVEGWSLYRGYAISSDPSHLWHMHLSCHRQFVENWDAVKGMLDILLDRDSEPPEEIDMGAVEDLKQYLDAKFEEQDQYMARRTHARVSAEVAEQLNYRQELFQVGALVADASMNTRLLRRHLSDVADVISSIAKAVAEPGMSDAERQQLAKDIATEVDKLRVTVQVARDLKEPEENES